MRSILRSDGPADDFRRATFERVTEIAVPWKFDYFKSLSARCHAIDPAR